MIELPCPYCGFNCEIPSNIEEKIECPNCGSICLYIQKSESHGTIDYRPSPEINDRGRQISELKHQLMLNKDRSWVPCYLKSEADQYIEELEESHKKEVEQLLMEIGELNHKVEHWKTWYKQAAEF